MKYSFKLVYVPGKQLSVADTLSRSPKKSNNVNTDYMEGKAAAVHTLVCSTRSHLEELKKSIQIDQTLQEVINCINHGWPEYKNYIKGEAKNIRTSRKNYTIRMEETKL